MKSKIDGYSALLHVALVALCIVTTLLALENHRLKAMMAGPGPGGPVVGQQVEPLGWLPLDGEETTLDLASGDQDSLLLVFTTDCPACRENQDAWKALHEDLGDSVNIVGVSLSELDATLGYRDAHALPFPVGVSTDPGLFTESLAITGVPMTIRVDSEGRVLGSWTGTLSDVQLAEVAERG